MSQQPVHPDTADDEAAARAVVNHHAQLATGLSTRVQTLLALVDTGHARDAEKARLDLLEYLRQEIVPHALAEERVLYPPAAALPTGQLLVTGMIEEHRTLTALVQRLAAATSPVRAAATARALEVLFEVHLHKENELILPLLVTTPDVALGQIVADMHAVLDAMHAVAQPGGILSPAGTPVEPKQDNPASSSDGCGCGGGCGCAGDSADRPADRTADAPILSVDTRLDVRQLPHDQRHPLVLSTLADLSTGQAVVLVAPHAPRPLLAQIEDRFGDRIEAQWLQSGPDVWQIRLARVS